MSRFEPIKLGWGGNVYVIPPNKVLGAIARVEEFVTMTELQRFTQERGTLPMAKIAQAFASVLTYAGATDANSDEVYAGMFGGETHADSVNAVTALLGMMIPPDSLVGKPTPGKPQPAAAKSSKKRIRRR